MSPQRAVAARTGALPIATRYSAFTHPKVPPASFFGRCSSIILFLIESRSAGVNAKLTLEQEMRSRAENKIAKIIPKIENLQQQLEGTSKEATLGEGRQTQHFELNTLDTSIRDLREIIADLRD